MVAGTPPIRAKKARYYEDARFKERILPPPALVVLKQGRPDDWTALPLPLRPETAEPVAADASDDDPTDPSAASSPSSNRGACREEGADRQRVRIDLADETEDDAARNSRMNRLMQGVARQVSLDPGDGMEL
jgi:type IV secretion system protein VirD4